MGSIKFSYKKISYIIGINIVIFCVVGLIVFGIGEAYFRTYYNMDNTLPSRIDKNIGDMNLPHADVIFTNKVSYWRKTRVNNLGFLDRDYVEDDSTKIVFIGDSFVQASEMLIENKSHILLENLVREKYPDKNYKTYAFGRSGTGQVNQLAYYDYIVKDMKPKIIVLIIVYNDFANNSPALNAIITNWHPEHQPRLMAHKKNGEIYFQPPEIDFRKYMFTSNLRVEENIFNYLNNESLFYKYFINKLTSSINILNFLKGNSVDGNLRNREKIDLLVKMGYLNDKDSEHFKSHDYERFAEETLPPSKIDALELTDFSFAQFKQRAERDNIKLYAYINHTVSDHCYKGSLQLKRMTDILDKYGIEYADECKNLQDKGIYSNAVTIPSDGHWNEYGHELAAEDILKLISKDL